MFADDVRSGLGKARGEQKSLPCSYLYDALGSALFEAITHLPEYGLTRADERLLRSAALELPQHLRGGEVVVAELGSGSGRKTKHVLAALEGRLARYAPIDVSAAALAACERDLASLALITPIEATYLEGLAHVRALRRPEQSLLVLFLGSTIGNFAPEEAGEFLRAIRAELRPGDRLLLGADLVKPEAQLQAAYDDPLGVTASFNKNLLVRMNRELGAHFRLDAFAHRARWNCAQSRVEMHLEALRDMEVEIPGAGMGATLAAGETIWTESSYKFQLTGLRRLCSLAGFTWLREWVDEAWPFAECLWQA